MDFEEKIEEFIALNNLFKKGDRVVKVVATAALADKEVGLMLVYH